MIWWIFPGVVGFFGVVVALTGLSRMGRWKVLSGGFRTLTGGVVVACAGLISMLGLNLQTYSRLTHERPVAIIDLESTGEPQSFLARVRLDGAELPVKYTIRGDEVYLDAKVLKWTPWANILGYDSVYKLDRLTGRYASLDDEQVKERSLYSVTSEPGVDVFELIKKRGGWLKAVDAYYGSGVFVPMADGASYEVRMSQNGLIARPANEIATGRLKGWRPQNAPPEMTTDQK